MINTLAKFIFVAAFSCFSNICFGQIAPAPSTFGLGTIHFEEDFENGVPAAWMNIAQDQAKSSSINNGWVIDRDTTYTSGTGPSAAQSGVFYAYCDGSSPIARGSIATMTTPAFSLTDADEPALLFYLSMYGRSGAFWVNVIDGASTDQVLATVSADVPGGIHGANEWEEIFIDLSPYNGKSIQLEFVTMKPDVSNNGDIAVDNIRVASMANTVPTLGEWGIIVLFLFMAVIGVVALRQENELEVSF